MTAITDRNLKNARCCKEGCANLAEYELRPLTPTARADDETHACLQHIKDLLTDAAAHEVVRLIAPGDASVSVYR